MPRRPAQPCMNPRCPSLLPTPIRNGSGYCGTCINYALRGTTTTLVSGPPCSGKTTYVRNHAPDRSILIDYDALLTALGGERGDDTYRPYVCQARDAVLDLFNQAANEIPSHLWAIHSGSKRADRRLYRTKYRATVIVLETPAEVCIERAKADGRPSTWPSFIYRWWDDYQRDSEDTVIQCETIGK